MTESIAALKKRYSGEWLAIAVPEPGGSLSGHGELVWHSPDEDQVWERIKGDTRLIYVTFAGPILPEGYAAAFLCGRLSAGVS